MHWRLVLLFLIDKQTKEEEEIYKLQHDLKRTAISQQSNQLPEVRAQAFDLHRDAPILKRRLTWKAWHDAQGTHMHIMAGETHKNGITQSYHFQRLSPRLCMWVRAESSVDVFFSLLFFSTFTSFQTHPVLSTHRRMECHFRHLLIGLLPR